MAILAFTLNPEALSRLHDALVCLGKFSESVSFEAVHDKLTITALNSSKSAYASFTLVANRFFSKYQYTPLRIRPTARFSCRIYNKALLSVFKGRSFDPEKETAIERCDVVVEDGEGIKSCFIIKIICRHGVLKTYRLNFESVPPVHAAFSKEIANNQWCISSRTLREFIEHFGPGTEQLDIYCENDRVSFTSYTDKIMSGNEILKQPLHTTVAIDIQEFAEFSAEEQLHIVISVKDFKSIITHAGITSTMVRAMYSRPANPFRLSYNEDGIMAEFILMTSGPSRGSSTTPAPNAGRKATKPVQREALETRSSSKRTASAAEMPPPGPSIQRKISRPSPPPPQPSIQSNALFFPEADDDRRWDPVNYDDDEDNEMLLWDTGVEDPSSGRRLQRSEPQSQNLNKGGESSTQAKLQEFQDPTEPLEPTERLPPTQRLSGIRGIFD